MTSPIIQRNAPTKNDQPHPIPKKNAGRWPNQVNTVSKEILSSEQKNEAKIEQNIESIDHKILSEILDQLLTIFPQKNEELNTITSDTKVLNDFVLGKLKKIKGLKELFQKNLKKLEELKETNQKVESDNKNIKNIIEEIKNVVIEYIERDYPLDGKNQEEIADLIVEKLDCSAKTISKIAQLLNIDIVKIVSTPIISIEKKEEIHTEIDLTKSIILDDYLDESKVDEKKEEIIKINLIEKTTSIKEKKDNTEILLKSLLEEGNLIKKSFDELKNTINDILNRIKATRVNEIVKKEHSKTLPLKCLEPFKALELYKEKLDNNLFNISSYINENCLGKLCANTLQELAITNESFSLEKTTPSITRHRIEIDKLITELKLLFINYFNLINIYLEVKYLILCNEIRENNNILNLQDFENISKNLWKEDNYLNLFNIEIFFQNLDFKPVIYQEIIYSIITKQLNDLLIEISLYHKNNTTIRKNLKTTDRLVLCPFYNEAKLSIKFSEIKWNSIKFYLKKIKSNLEKRVPEKLTSLDDSSIQSVALIYKKTTDEVKRDMKNYSDCHLEDCQELEKLQFVLNKFDKEVSDAKIDYDRTHDAIIRGGYDYHTFYNRIGKNDAELLNNIFSKETLDLTEKSEQK